MIEIHPNASNALAIPTVLVTGPTGNWTAKVYSPYVGQWEIIFTAEVTYSLWDIAAAEYLRDENNKIRTVTFSNLSACTFKATTSKFKIVIEPDVQFPNRSVHSVGLTERGTIRIKSIDPNDPLIQPISFLDSCENSDNVVLEANMYTLQLFGFAPFVATSEGTTTITATKGTDTDSITVNVLLPSGFEAYGVEREDDHNGNKNFFLAENVVVNVVHKENTASVGLFIYFYITPGNVAFPFLSFREFDILEQDEILGNPVGYFLEKYPTGISHDPQSWGFPNSTDAPGFPTNDPGNATIRPNLIHDGIYTDNHEAPYKDGSLTWNMQMQYTTNVGDPSKTVSIGGMTMKFVIDASGKMIVTKAGVGAEAIASQKTSAALPPS